MNVSKLENNVQRSSVGQNNVKPNMTRIAGRELRLHPSPTLLGFT
jgi:hypothetical protein